MVKPKIIHEQELGSLSQTLAATAVTLLETKAIQNSFCHSLAGQQKWVTCGLHIFCRSMHCRFCPWSDYGQTEQIMASPQYGLLALFI